MSVTGTTNAGTLDEICYDLFGTKNPPSNDDDQFLRTNLQRYRQILQNNLRPYVDVLPIAVANITEDLNEAVNLLVERKYHISKYHFSDADTLKEQFDLVWNSIVTYLKAIPTARTQPVTVAGNFADGDQLLQNIPNITDENGSLLPGF